MSQTPDSISAALKDIAGTRLLAPRVDGGNVRLLLDVTGLSPEAAERLEQAVRQAALALPGVEQVLIAQTAEKVDRTLIVVGSGKGGVGKSTLSANLALALSRLGRKVGLIDADIYGPSQPRIMGSLDKPEARDKQIIAGEAHGIRMLSIGQLVAQDTALAWRGPMAASALGQLIDADWGDAELLVVDLPPGTGDVQLSLIQKWRPQGAVIVSTPQDLALIDARRAIDLFKKMNVSILGLVENMSGYICPHCGEASDPFGAGGAEAAAAELGIDMLGRVPLRLSIRKASDAGTPPAAGDGPDAELFTAIAHRLVEKLNRSGA